MVMRRQAWAISVISLLVLALELALIRLIPSEIKAISYFTNLLLFSSFFGLGVGCIAYRVRNLMWLLPAGVFLLFIFVFLSRGIVVYDTGGTVHYWLQSGDTRNLPTLQIPIFAAAVVTFVLASIPFVSLGQALAQAMDHHPRLVAYSWDIAGSLLGTIVFALTSYLGVPPWVWIALGMSIWAFVFVDRWGPRIACIASGACFLALTQTSHSWKWSPYYFIQYRATDNQITVWVNSSFHQEAVNFDSKDPAYRPVAQAVVEKFNVAYDMYRSHHGGASPAKVLILGAGTGNDVGIALRNGARDVTAVEIDPVILELGRSRNAARPYQSPHVKTVVDDGRHFLWNTSERYDLIVFGTLDSQTLLSGQANLRLENYIYTRECFRDARQALREGGMVAAYYSVFKPWFFGRIYATVREAFPGELRMVGFQNNYLFNTLVMAGRGVSGFASDPKTEEVFAGSMASSDDWPYVYLERRTISPLYWKVFGMVGLLILGAFVLLRRLHPAHESHANFFFMGLGFTLMEAAAIVRLALVFGTTWVVSAVVFSSALLTIFLANLFVQKNRGLGFTQAWCCLLGFLVLNVVFPMSVLFGVPPILRLLAAAVLVGGPVFFAGVCFSRLFGRQTETGYALGINLVGAMAGGLIEYVSMVVGMRSVWLVIIAVYVLVLLTTMWSSARRSGSTAAVATG